MARENTVECPSGLVVKFRGLKGRDLDTMRDPKAWRDGEAICNLLDSCTIEVINRGIYTAPNFRWIDALIGDQTAGFIALRNLTAGQRYDFNVKCEDCNAIIRWQIDLQTLDQKKLAAEDAERFCNGNDFVATADGREIHFGLRTGRDQKNFMREIQRMQRPNLRGADHEPRTRTMVGLAMRISRVEGIDAENKADEKKLVLEWLEDLDLRELRKLMKELEKPECGVETGIEVICEACGLQQEVDLPLDATFLKTMLI